MRTRLFLISLHTISILFLSAQNPGEWTWIHGANTLSFIGNYGIMGVPSPTNKPAGVYEASEWTDNQGNFWLYGGQGAYNSSSYRWSDDLWKYDVTSNQWTWVKGSGGLPDQKPVYGTQGVASTTNTPGERVESQSWSDNNGNLWLFGGISYAEIGGGQPYNDLWKYNITTNMWTWMKGDTVPAPYGNDGYAIYGIKGVENVNNKPPYQQEMGITWYHNNYLWMLDYKGCMWKYRINTNNWIWVNGDTTGAKVYGQKGVPDSSNTPGFNYFSYSRWKDSKNNFWFFYNGSGYSYKDIFKYDVNTNMWTWVWGTGTLYDPVSYYSDTLCDYSNIEEQENVIPFSRCEARACWIDNCDNLWLMGGFGGDHTSEVADFNDLIYFDTFLLKWVWVGNDTTHNYNSVYGTMGISSPLNRPAARSGAIPFKDIDGNLWLFGGINVNNSKSYGDLWRFALDSGCTICETPYNVDISEEHVINDNIIVYPNPATNELTIDFSTKDKYFFELFDIIGAKRKSVTVYKVSQTKTIDLKDIENGLYFYSIFDIKGDKIKTGKLLIIK